MLSTCSPHHDSCVMVQMHSHSPTHPGAQYDPHSAIREIRRSLSRSPSKGAELRQYSFRSSPAKGSIPFYSSPLSPSRRLMSESHHNTASFSSPHTTRLGQHARVQRPVLRRSVQGVSVVRTRTSPKSPTKRAFHEFGQSASSSPMLRKRSSTELDIESSTGGEISEDKENAKQTTEDSMMWKSIQTRQEKRRSGGFLTEVIPLSPMKRTGEPMNVDVPDCGSPSTKRRSVHTSSGLDFSIFDSDSLHAGLEKRSQDDNDWCRSTPPYSGGRFSTIPKRSSSLRKSTLQQRQPERFNLGRHMNVTNTSSWNDGSPDSHGKKADRLSLDNHLPAMGRESPFSAQGNLLNASIHPLSSAQNSQPLHSRHPLSRTMTQSSSTPSVQDDSPTHEPIRRSEPVKPHDFSKSMPVGALRPADDSADENEYSSQNSFATPANYKFARPLPAAFMSTGLISKKNRNVEDPDAGLPKAHMPDTPCKKQSLLFESVHAAAAQRQSFGVPSTPAETPFGPPKVSAFPWSRSTGLFGVGGNKNSLGRKTSFASIDGDDKINTQSPSSRGDSQSTETDYPPTPSKHATSIIRNEESDSSPSSHTKHHPPRNIPGSTQVSRFTSSKLSPVQASPTSIIGDNEYSTDDSPSLSLKPKSLVRVIASPSLSFTQNRALRNLNSPTPLSRRSITNPTLLSTAVRCTKKLSQSPVSPHLDHFDRFSPHTPQEPIFPPDPSGLSISGRAERPVTRMGTEHVPYIPATPTGPREYFGHFSNRPSLNLNAPDIADVDRSLTSKFDTVDLVGTGEFSQVYRVTLPRDTSPFSSFGASQSTSQPSSPDRVWAVKKSRYPYSGPKDRQRRVYEVDVLKALGQADHIVNFVDSWEDKGHLYIQTNFYEEGTLDVFLGQIGVKGRLDDFRIWKILLELSLGLRHIHNSGFIHLDLKPANVLITFDGTLKIGDFGMATKWPAKAGIEGEGDREYIGPEILMGQYDKPADIFALGLIMLETAGNVELPDNGVSWQKLRQGDMSDVPSLTFSSGDSAIFRDANGNPVIEEINDAGHDDSASDQAINLARSGELTHAPDFMTDADHEQALDHVVRWMISPDPTDRPVIEQVLQTDGVRFAETRRRAGATIFEGNWGPADEVIAEDAEMIDV